MRNRRVAIIFGGAQSERLADLDIQDAVIALVGEACELAPRLARIDASPLILVPAAGDEACGRLFQSMPGGSCDALLWRGAPRPWLSGMTGGGLEEAPNQRFTGADGERAIVLLQTPHPAADFDGDVRFSDDDIVAACQFVRLLGYSEIGLLDLGDFNDLAMPGSLSRRPVEIDPIMSAISMIGGESHAKNPATLLSLNPRSDAALSGRIPIRSASGFLGLRRLDAVLVPLTPRERDRALLNLESWAEEERLPWTVFPEAPRIDLVFAYSGLPDASLSDPILEFFAGSEVLRQSFRNCEVHFIGLEGEDDLYVRDASGPVPRYGFKAGPNLLFFGALRLMRRYSGFALLMETDCTPLRRGWLKTIDEVCRRHPKAWVIGSIYRGMGVLGNDIKRHLNGNAIYSVGNTEYWEFLDGAYLSWLQHHIDKKDPNLAFDTAWERFFRDASAENANDASWRVVQSVYSRFRACDEIVNIAGEAEMADRVRWSREALRGAFPYAAIVHGPVADVAVSIDPNVYSANLDMLSQHHQLVVDETGLTLQSWIAEGAWRMAGPSRWIRTRDNLPGRCGLSIRRAAGLFPAHSHVRAKISATAEKDVLLRFSAQLADFTWDAATQEVMIEAGRRHSIAVSFSPTRSGTFIAMTIEAAGFEGSEIAIDVAEISAELTEVDGSRHRLSIGAGAGPSAYGARSVIGASSEAADPVAAVDEDRRFGSASAEHDSASEPAHGAGIAPDYVFVAYGAHKALLVRRSALPGEASAAAIAILRLEGDRIQSAIPLAVDNSALSALDEGDLIETGPEYDFADFPARAMWEIDGIAPDSDLAGSTEELALYVNEIRQAFGSSGLGESTAL